MDQTLKEFLTGLPDSYWEETITRLTQEALGMLATYGCPKAYRTSRPSRYAVEAVEKVFLDMEKGTKGQFDPNRGDSTKPVKERFWLYLKLACLRPVITRSLERDTSRAKFERAWPIDAEGDEVEVPDKAESAALDIEMELLDGADEELARFISEAISYLEAHQDRRSVNWTELQRRLGISRHACDQLRARLENHLEVFMQSRAAV